MTRSRYVLGMCSVAIGVFCLTLSNSPAQAELYVAGQIGANIPNDVTNLEGTGLLSGISISDASLQNSFMYGAKLGYYFDAVKWLGVETEVFNSNPNIKQQNLTFSAGGASITLPVSGQSLRVLNWSPITIVVRYQAGQFEPYAGVGMGVYFAHVSSGGESSSDTNVGFNSQLGLRFKVTQHLAVFGEWKYNRAHLNFDLSTPNGNAGGFEGDYSANIFAFGVGYHF
jgi:opacity protein-like surface antigen